MKVSYAEYLALEERADIRHEWFDGQVFAMAGGTIAHGELSAAMMRELGTLALACGCRVFSSDVRVRVAATGLSTYPDVTVVCGELMRSAEDRNAVSNPALLVEVLSDSTEGYDRGEKFRHYQTLGSLRDYVLVSQHDRRIEVFSREGDHWTLRSAGPGQTVPLTALPGAALAIDAIYAGVELSPAPVWGAT